MDIDLSHFSPLHLFFNEHLGCFFILATINDLEFTLVQMQSELNMRPALGAELEFIVWPVWPWSGASLHTVPWSVRVGSIVHMGHTQDVSNGYKDSLESRFYNRFSHSGKPKKEDRPCPRQAASCFGDEERSECLNSSTRLPRGEQRALTSVTLSRSPLWPVSSEERLVAPTPAIFSNILLCHCLQAKFPT